MPVWKPEAIYTGPVKLLERGVRVLVSGLEHAVMTISVTLPNQQGAVALRLRMLNRMIQNAKPASVWIA